MNLDGVWAFKADSAGIGVREHWHRADTDRSGWDACSVPQSWSSHKLKQYDGSGWYARVFDFEADAGASYAVVLDAVDDRSDVWFNGERIGSHAGYGRRMYCDVTTLLKSSANVLLVRVVDLAGPDGMIGSVKIMRYKNEEELIQSDWHNKPIVRSPDWVRDAVIYEIFPRVFSKDGSLAGVERRIPELRDLGVTVLWLMPIHPIGVKNRKGVLGSPYSVRDYLSVNAEYGNLTDVQSLVRAAHDAGMKVIIDVVANHTAWDNEMISSHPEWYTRDARDHIIPPIGEWSDVADLDYSNMQLRRFVSDMLLFWIDSVGLDGFRCDVAEMVPCDFWRAAFAELRLKKELFLLAEGSTPDLHVDAFDMTYAWNTYDILPTLLDGSESVCSFDEALRRERLLMPAGALRMRFTTNHDKNAYDAPAIERYGPDASKAVAVLLHLLPGVPLIYNGQEVGSDTRLGLFEKESIDWTSDTHGFRDLYTQLNTLRREHAALRRGSLIAKSVSAYPSLYLGIREYDGECIFFAVNLGASPLEATVHDSSLAGFARVFGNCACNPDADRLDMKVPAYGYFVGRKKG